MKTIDNTSAYPELDRQRALIDSGKAPLVQSFIEWLPENGYVIARRCNDPIHRDRGRLSGGPLSSYCGVCEGTGIVETWIDPHKMMADFFQIDLNKIETEQRALLDSLRDQNDKD